MVVVGVERTCVIGAGLVGERVMGARDVRACVEEAGMARVGVEGASVLGACLVGDPVVVVFKEGVERSGVAGVRV